MRGLLNYLGWLTVTLCMALVVGQCSDRLAAFAGLEPGLMFGLCASLGGGSLAFLVICAAARLAAIAWATVYPRCGWRPRAMVSAASPQNYFRGLVRL
jgi:Na+/citrate or Na+/malate symporter